MALRDWSVRRILSIWTGWMAGLLVLLLGAVILSPTGSVSLTISPAGLPLASRIALGLIGLAAACLPPRRSRSRGIPRGCAHGAKTNRPLIAKQSVSCAWI